MTWNQIGLHQKKFAFLNWNNYYDEIQKFTFKAKEECFTHTYDNFNANFFNSNQEFFQWIS
jgi:predicted Rossmann-fold nucleotide-binding protein